MKKLKFFLEKNIILITVISSLLIPIIAIISNIISVNNQIEIQKDLSSPIFYLSKLNNNEIKIVNKGGLVTYFQFQQFTIVDVTINNKKVTLEISYADENRLGNMSSNINNLNEWIYISTLNDLNIKKIQQIIEDRITKLFSNDVHTFIEIKNYYKVACYDYESSYVEFHYKLTNNNFSYYTIEKSYYEDSKIFGGISILGFENAEDFYKQLDNLISDFLLHLRWYN